MTDDERKLCIKCKHVKKVDYHAWKCCRPDLYSRVHGEPRPLDCEEERKDLSGRCGKDGEFWEPRV